MIQYRFAATWSLRADGFCRLKPGNDDVLLDYWWNQDSVDVKTKRIKVEWRMKNADGRWKMESCSKSDVPSPSMALGSPGFGTLISARGVAWC